MQAHHSVRPWSETPTLPDRQRPIGFAHLRSANSLRLATPYCSAATFRQINSGLRIKSQFDFVKPDPKKGEVDENCGLSNCLGRDAVGLLCPRSHHRESRAGQTAPTAPRPDSDVERVNTRR